MRTLTKSRPRTRTTAPLHYVERVNLAIDQVKLRGGIDPELRAFQWLFGTWLPRCGYVPDDHPSFEAFIDLPFAHGMEYFELHAQLPVRRG